ncbi:unnamed protein product [Protopolystoma xenopodis]|uniref:Peptidase M24 C-terminal domain-containing protein n=1 Tax=Protopolystoma xenopodis TaxID=117903 RepID=A0A448WDK9_9PLAT|nr:unnamed protein product [Protopolystoma xenopodis]
MTIEPGYYPPGKHGIRLENVVFVVPAPDDPPAEPNISSLDTSLHQKPTDTSSPSNPAYAGGDPEASGSARHSTVAEGLPAQPAWLTFDPVTLVPFHRRLIDPTQMSNEELAWLNAYHRRTRAALTQCIFKEGTGTQLSSDRQRTLVWLNKETEPIQKN